MQIRPYRPSDEAACLEIFRSHSTDFFAGLDESLFQKWLYRVVELDDHYYYVVEDGHEVKGCGGFILDMEGKKAILAWGMVHKDFQGMGIGESLLLYRIDKIRAKLSEGKIITLDTTQRTFPFFEKLGFKVIRVQEGYHSRDLDRYEMELEIA